MTTVGLCVICHDRPTELAAALASAGRQWDEIVVLDMASRPPLTPPKAVTWRRSEENLGVTAGRNLLAEACTNDVLVFLDDDAVFLAEAVPRLRASFDADPNLALVAFKVLRAGGGRVGAEYPFRGRARNEAEARPCAYFVGCGYAVRRSALEAVGGYDEAFFYSTEEVDLGFRLLQGGWALLYDPDVVIEHRPSPRGRSVAPRVPQLVLRNRLIVVRRYLPVPVAIVHGLAWLGRSFVLALRSSTVRPWLKGLREGLSVPVDRRPVSWRKAWMIHRMGGRVLW